MTPYRFSFWDVTPASRTFGPVVSDTETVGFTGLKPPVSDRAKTAGLRLEPVSRYGVIFRRIFTLSGDMLLTVSTKVSTVSLSA